MMRIVFRPEARSEALAAQDWYESRALGLGLEFARAFEVALASAVRDPQAFSLVEGLCRRVLLRKFPYSLIYRADAEELVVIAVFHHRREPLALVTRTDKES
ncbi:MAG: type II toxin-antitoxin system RelE/ParE family toxin [Arenimonas sp.]